MISPVVFTSIAQLGLLPVANSAISLVAGVIRDFFQNIFLNPGDNYVALLAICGVIVAPCIGIAFLIKVIYDKFVLQKTI